MLEVLLATQLFTTMLLGNRTEARLRVQPCVATISGSCSGVTVGVDLATTPTARIDMKTRRMDFSFGYAPSITWGDLQTAQPPQLFQVADASLSFVARRTTLSVGTSVSYGDFNFTYLLPASTSGPTPPPPQVVPTTETVRYFSSHTAMTLRRSWRRLALSLTGEHNVAGGISGQAALLTTPLPLISTPHANATVAYDATRLDVLSTLADANLASSAARPCDPTTGLPPLNPNDPNAPICAPRDEWVTLRESWRHRFTRLSTLTLSAGAAAIRTQLNPGAEGKYNVAPTGQVTLTHDFGVERPWRALLDVDARIEPLIDIRYAIVESRFQASGAWTIARGRTAVVTRVAFVRSVPPTTIDATYLNFSVEGVRKVDRRFDVGLGIRGAWQHSITSPFYIAGLYLAFIWHEPRIRL